MSRSPIVPMFAVFAVFLVGADKPVIERVEPPSWWSAPAAAEILLLAEGANLQGVKVSTKRAGVEIVRAESPNAGGALFVEIKLAAGFEPGPVTLEFSSGDAVVSREWTILPHSTHKPSPLGTDDVIYLAMPDRFANGDPSNDSAEMIDDMLDRDNPHAYHGGDFAGLKAKLPYLKDLGITAIWLTPVYKQAPLWFHTKVAGRPRKFADFHGYSPIDFFDTNPRFGTKAEYRALVDEAHKLGLKVIQDQIVGYTGPQHHWAKKPPAQNWFHGSVDNPLPCNFRFDAQANPHAKESDRKGLTDGWFFGILPDLNTENPLVKRLMIQESLWWTELFQADAIRLDTYPMVDRAFWRDWSKAQKALHPEIRAVGEAWINDAAELSFFVGGKVGWDGVDPGIDTVFDFPFNLAIVDVLSNKASATKVGKALSRDFLFARPGELVTFLDNHDTKRLSTMPNVSIQRHQLAAALLLTSRGIPQLTWGDEVGLEGHSDDRRSVPGAWPSDTRDSFVKSGRAPGEENLFRTYRDLLKLRKEHPALRRGTTTEVMSSDTMYLFVREYEGDRVLVALNFGPKAAGVMLPDGLDPKRPLAIMGSESRIDGTGLMILPNSFAVFVK